MSLKFSKVFAADAEGAPAAAAAAAAPAAAAAGGSDTVAAGKAADTVEGGSRDTTLLKGSDGKPPAKAEGSDGKPAEGQKKDDAKPTGAPETYAEFTVPQGMEIDKAQLGGFLPLFKELNLTQEQAQKLVTADIERYKKAGEAQEKYWNDMVADWQKTAKEDKEIGGLNFDTNLGLANRLIDKFADVQLDEKGQPVKGEDGKPVSQFKEMLKSTLVGNHVEMIRFFSKIAKALGEDKLEVGGAATTTEVPPEQAMYPSMFKKA